MKDGKFETQAEIYQALLDGKKIRMNTWADVYYLYLEKGMQKDERGAPAAYHFDYPCNWPIYEEHKPKKKVTLYRYTYKYGSAIHQTNFTSKNWSTYGGEGDYLLLTESKEIEVDDV